MIATLWRLVHSLRMTAWMLFTEGDQQYESNPVDHGIEKMAWLVWALADKMDPELRHLP